MKTIRVVAAVIRDEDKIFATARGYGEFKGQWEFPGGKIEPGEAPEDALKREIREELDTEIEVGELIHTIEWDYPNFHLSMDCFWCSIVKGELTLLEAEDAKWLTRDTLDSVQWLPADLSLIAVIRDEMEKTYCPKLKRIKIAALFNEMIVCTTKKELVETWKKHGLKTTTGLSEKETKDDKYIQALDGSRIQFSARTIKLFTSENVKNDPYFTEYKMQFKPVKDGSYRKYRLTLSKTVENFELFYKYLADTYNV